MLVAKSPKARGPTIRKTATATRVKKRAAKTPPKRGRPAGTYRQRNAARMRAAGAVTRDVRIPTLSPEDRAERLRREADDELWLQSYWSAFSVDEFYPLSAQQRQMVADFRAALEFGGDRADAASRGEGKTTFAVALTLKEILRGNVDFAILLGANADNAGNMLGTIRGALDGNAELARYYPEVCAPVAALENTAQRAGTQTASGDRFDNGEPFEMAPTAFHWAGNKLVFPNVPGSPSAGAIVVSQGLDSALRGMKIANRRPRVVLIDDPDTDDTIGNPLQAAKLLTKIDRGIAALGSQSRPVTRIALVTIASRVSVAAQLTDRELYPSWRGRRFRFLLKPPTATAKWAEFVGLCRDGWRNADADQEQPPIPLAAHQFYLSNQAEMDAGAEISNPNRYDKRRRADGSTVEASALEHYHGWVARIGEENTRTEFDNEPPDPQTTEADGLTPHRIQHQVSGHARGVIPPDATLLTMGVDVGKFLLHWIVTAWRADGTSWLIDYGTHDVRGTSRGTDEGMEQGIISAVRSLVASKQDAPYSKPSGEVLPIAMTLIDSGWGITTTAVYAACRDVGRMVQTPRGQEPDVQPAKGNGDGAKSEAGRRPAPWRNWQKRDWDHYPGDNWCRSKQRKDRVFLWLHNAGHWKDWGIQRWLTPIDRPGTRFIWGEFGNRDRQHAMDHAQISYHLCANCYRPEPSRPGVIAWGERPGMNGDKDHWQDAQELADVAASAMGIGLELAADKATQPIVQASLAEISAPATQPHPQRKTAPPVAAAAPLMASSGVPMIPLSQMGVR